MAGYRKDKDEFLSRIIMMDESNVPFYVPEGKQATSQWLEKKSRPPIKAKRQESRRKQMVLSFFCNKGLIYQHMCQEKTSVSAEYFQMVLSNFLKFREEKTNRAGPGDWVLHMDNCSVHTAESNKEFLIRKGI